MVITDTIPLPPAKQLRKIRQLSVAPLIGEAISRIHRGESVGALFSSEIQLVQEMVLWSDRTTRRPSERPTGRTALMRRVRALHASSAT